MWENGRQDKRLRLHLHEQGMLIYDREMLDIKFIRDNAEALKTASKNKNLDPDLIDQVITDPENEENLKKVRKKVHKLMHDYPLYRAKHVEID